MRDWILGGREERAEVRSLVAASMAKKKIHRRAAEPQRAPRNAELD